jgi:hypothetical protein
MAKIHYITIMSKRKVIYGTLKGQKRIHEKLHVGQMVSFENIFEDIAIKYVPGEPGIMGTFFAKYYGKEEYEIAYWTNVVSMGELEGKIISKTKYDNYHKIKP